MIICFATDLHGRANLYEQLADLACHTRADLVILGGDLLPDGEMNNPCAAQVHFVTSYVVDWVERLRRRLPGCAIATIFGNHDWLCSAAAFEQLETLGMLTVLRPDRPADFGGWRIIGYSYAPPSPFWARDFERLDLRTDKPPLADGVRWDPASRSVAKAPPEYYTTLPTIEDDLAKLPRLEGRWIFVAHAPPFGSGLDLLISGEPVGSHAVRAFIEQRQPPISLHGHLHDSPYKSGRFYTQIGKTFAINPGQGTEALAAVTFDPDALPGSLTPHGVRHPAP